MLVRQHFFFSSEAIFDFKRGHTQALGRTSYVIYTGFRAKRKIFKVICLRQLILNNAEGQTFVCFHVIYVLRVLNCGLKIPNFTALIRLIGGALANLFGQMVVF